MKIVCAELNVLYVYVTCHNIHGLVGWTTVQDTTLL